MLMTMAPKGVKEAFSSSIEVSVRKVSYLKINLLRSGFAPEIFDI